MKSIDDPLKVGTAIRTNPREGYWGVAVVLSNFAATNEAEPRCHIATTPVIFRHPFTWPEIDQIELCALRFKVRYRPSPSTLLLRDDICISLFQNTRVSSLEIIGQVEASSVYAGPLSERIGRDRASGEFSYSGRIDGNLGSQAVFEWRLQHDKEAFEAESAKSTAEWFASEEERRRVAREKARNRQRRGT